MNININERHESSIDSADYEDVNLQPKLIIENRKGEHKLATTIIILFKTLLSIINIVLVFEFIKKVIVESVNHDN